MKSNDSKTARYIALLNAEEFIKGHGEEGGIDEDTFDFDKKLYLREAAKVANMLSKLAEAYRKKHNIK